MKLSDVRVGLYLARKADGTEAILLVWGVYPFLQAYIVPAELEDRPQFHDAKIAEWEFVARVPEPKELISRLQVEK